jgi:isochorismate hydrolase
MDGEEMHRFALRDMAATVGWVLESDEILAALDRGGQGGAPSRGPPSP